MKIILLKDINKLGHRGAVKNVSDGYALNFLFPQKLACPASDDNIKKIAVAAQSVIVKKEKTAANTQHLIASLAEKKFVIKKPISAKGKLFAAVGVDDIVNVIKKSTGLSLDKKTIHLKDHLKEIGAHNLSLTIGGESVILHLTVEKK